MGKMTVQKRIFSEALHLHLFLPARADDSNWIGNGYAGGPRWQWRRGRQLVGINRRDVIFNKHWRAQVTKS